MSAWTTRDMIVCLDHKGHDCLLGPQGTCMSAWTTRDMIVCLDHKGHDSHRIQELANICAGAIYREIARSYLPIQLDT